MFDVLVILCPLVIILMHIFYIPFDRFLSSCWPSWKTTAGGFAVAYIFFVMLPKLSVIGSDVIVANDYPRITGYSIVFSITLVGFLSYLIIDIFSQEESTGPLMHRIQAASFFFYNLLLGKLLGGDGLTESLVLLLGTAIMILHLAGMNHVFCHWDEKFFQKYMRWIMSLGIFFGVVTGQFHLLNEKAVSVITAFMSGAILINVIYYELPTKRKDNLFAFIGGIAAFIIAVSFIRSVQ